VNWRGATPEPRPRRRWGRLLRRLIAWPLVLALVVVLAFQVSPWPGALVIRAVFDIGASRTAEALRKHVPPGVVATLDEVYDAADPDARLDVYRPADATAPLTTVVWVHGGGWVSGDKADIGNYARVLAGRGFTVVSVGYSIAPRATYPTPARQVVKALAHLVTHAGRLQIDPNRIVLAGDSAGGQIAGQVANLVTSPAYAAAVGISPSLAPGQLVGMLLFCGAYDSAAVRMEGALGWFVHTVLWSYSGRSDFASDPTFLRMNVTPNVTARFPPSFISAGNGDPLGPQSVALADRLENLGVRVDRLFFPPDHQPALPHEYQFNLDTADGRVSLERAVAFLMGL